MNTYFEQTIDNLDEYKNEKSSSVQIMNKMN